MNWFFRRINTKVFRDVILRDFTRVAPNILNDNLFIEIQWLEVKR